MSQDLMIWEREVLAGHRWGAEGEEEAREELARLRELWDAIPDSEQPARDMCYPCVALESCNWDLETGILDICTIIGSGKPVPREVGHKGHGDA